MINFKRAEGFTPEYHPFGYVEVHYTEKDVWHLDEFWAMVDEHIAQLKEDWVGYERHATFDSNHFYRYFKKFKKTYPVMMQFESVLLKDRPFPKYSAVTAIPFLLELETHQLSGTHDAEMLQGQVELYAPAEKEPFPGMRGEERHTYPGDFAARDEGGIIFSLIAGADQRTSATENSYHVFYPLFSTPNGDPALIEAGAKKVEEFVKLLCPHAQVEFHIV